MIYSTKVREVGKDSSEFISSGMIVLFGSEAPPELRPYCFIIDRKPLQDSIEIGDVLSINDIEYNIIEVGNQVNKNLRDLGHITIDFRGQVDDIMPGTLYVEKKSIPDIKVGSEIVIKAKQYEDKR
ncbi:MULTISPECIES: PTS glucitol/sorbitol transporter subunit IIA [Clostridium]|uniref:PTS system glucitol/sorbitol-specific transporter subunit IIA n=2 Tax=Clostridium TaxID=1485 RepID=A0A151AI44_9CLOT|nr:MULTISPECIES: PTS glucitol/sorbitol transporter subunit IIA [Clostridium]KYH27321.1 PTS system glucitol/sorbitol-specific transporter subunit IIA [Clostridium colicanis DSM 13634]MBE6043514.1 PTS sorbitol transporter subunit IIA [Clostridium thermopalmarium]PRR74817.1 PTS system glucitol/sorbitol-specific transporter subunit IIA [Clostridium thermopalmarium DSM 5974]PVZ15879.1 PTS system glucitol/sorbitol-specific IIA component [Clostridium thermopalmarium DSM 5974]